VGIQNNFHNESGEDGHFVYMLILGSFRESMKNTTWYSCAGMDKLRILNTLQTAMYYTVSEENWF
jgi:hypothetical protein